MAKGYNRPASMGGGGMMQQLKKLQDQMAQAQAELAELTVEASVGGGAVKVVMTGDQKCKSITLSPDLTKDADTEMLQDLILSAVNLAIEKSQELREQKMAPFLTGMPGMGF